MGITPKTYIFGIIAFMFVIVGGVVIIADFAKTSPNFITEDFTGFNRTFNRVNELTNATDGLRASIEDTTPEWGVFGGINALVKTIWSALKNIFGSLDFMLTALTGIQSIFGVPPWVVALLTSFVITMIAFAVYEFIFKGGA